MGRGSLLIDRCLCHQVLFAQLKPVAQAHRCTNIHGLQERVNFGKTCTLCHPYVRRMLATGETVFHEVITDDSSS